MRRPWTSLGGEAVKSEMHGVRGLHLQLFVDVSVGAQVLCNATGWVQPPLPVPKQLFNGAVVYLHGRPQCWRGSSFGVQERRGRVCSLKHDR